MELFEDDDNMLLSDHGIYAIDEEEDEPSADESNTGNHRDEALIEPLFDVEIANTKPISSPPRNKTIQDPISKKRTGTREVRDTASLDAIDPHESTN